MRMWLQVLVPIVLVAVCQMVTVPSSKLRYDYCVIGAGPAGLQMGYFLKRAGRDYVILERSHQAGEIWPKKMFGVLFWWNMSLHL
jgi:ribulose 1,5-bisphosphate synthetase/thiazole synthase